MRSKREMGGARLWPEAFGHLLYYGDCLQVLEDSGQILEFQIEEGSVDLAYVDPPFVSAVDDPMSDQGEVTSWSTFLAPRIKALGKTLKPTGSIWFRSVPTYSDYAKRLIDQIVGAENFLGELVWPARESARKLIVDESAIFDVMLVYRKSEQSQLGLRDLATLGDARLLPDPAGAILKLSTKPREVILDPFCGGGEMMTAALSLDRRGLGIDPSYSRIENLHNVIDDRFGPESTPRVEGIPADLPGAQALHKRDCFKFQRWADSLIRSKVGKMTRDGGIDGKRGFPLPRSPKGRGTVVVSVKGGRKVGPEAVRELIGTDDEAGEEIQMRILIVMKKKQISKQMIERAKREGFYTYPGNGRNYPRVQMISVQELLENIHPLIPPAWEMGEEFRLRSTFTDDAFASRSLVPASL